MAVTNNKRFWFEFIKLYKSLPAVWDLTSEDYKDREKKKKAYEKLLEKLQQIDDEADRDALMRKINTLRSSYRRELRKVLEGERTGEPFTPTLWYFKEMDFLRGAMKPELRLQRMEEFSMMMASVDESTLMGNSFNNNKRENSPKIRLKHKRRKNNVEKEEEEVEEEEVGGKMNSLSFLEKAVDAMRETQDEAEIFAKVWAAEFRKLDELQKLHAKRTIDEVLYQGRFGNLTFESSHIRLDGSSRNRRAQNKEVTIEAYNDVDDGEVNSNQFEEEELIDYTEGKPIIISEPATVKTKTSSTMRQCQSIYRRHEKSAD